MAREFNLFKEFILVILAIKYLALMISCVVAVFMFSLTPSIAALIKRITLDWGQLWNRKKHAREVVRLGAQLANEEAA